MSSSDYISPSVSCYEVDTEGIHCSSTEFDIIDWDNDGNNYGGDVS